MHIDIAFLTKTKLVSNNHTSVCFGYCVGSTAACSSSQGSVAYAFRCHDDQFDISSFHLLGHDVASIIVSSQPQCILLLWAYIFPSNYQSLYQSTIEDIYTATATTAAKLLHVIMLGHLNVTLCDITNPCLEALQPLASLASHEDCTAATIGALSSLSFKEVSQCFHQQACTGIWTWSQL